MKDYVGELPVLGVWERVTESAARLSDVNSDARIKSLIRNFNRVDEKMRSIKPQMLIPAHGDAHAGNLIPSPDGWLWTDFEDVCFMPEYWDLASFVANRALFNGLQTPILRYMLDDSSVISNIEDFSFALSARTLMSIVGNLDLAIQGYGDLTFAKQQLALADDFLEQVNRNI